MLCQTWIKGRLLLSCTLAAGMGILMPNPPAHDWLNCGCHPCFLWRIQASNISPACDFKGNDVERFGAKIVLNEYLHFNCKGYWKLIVVKKRFACVRPPPQTRSTLIRKVVPTGRSRVQPVGKLLCQNGGCNFRDGMFQI